jgi:hypothetical protein
MYFIYFIYLFYLFCLFYLFYHGIIYYVLFYLFILFYLYIVFIYLTCDAGFDPTILYDPTAAQQSIQPMRWAEAIDYIFKPEDGNDQSHTSPSDGK